MPDITADQLTRARAGELGAIDAILRAVQPAVFNLAVRMLGHREDGRDATQEILLKIVTHLGSLRDAAAFGGWSFQIARNHLLTVSTRRRERPEISIDHFEQRLASGLAFAAVRPDEAILTPEDKAAARELAINCTQGMLMCLDRPHRLAYLLDVVFGLSSDQAGEVLGITPAAHRKRLSRARRDLDGLTGRACGLANPTAPCRCASQLPASRAFGAASSLQLEPEEQWEAEGHFDRLTQLADAAALFRAHPDYRAPATLVAAIRSVLDRHYTGGPRQ